VKIPFPKRIIQNISKYFPFSFTKECSLKKVSFFLKISVFLKII